MATARKVIQAAPEPTIRVMATRMGYIGNERKRDGDVFDIPAHAFSDRWMVRVDPEMDTTQSNSMTALQRQLAKQKAQAAAGIELPAGRDDDEVI